MSLVRSFNSALHHWHSIIASWVPLLLHKHLFPPSSLASFWSQKSSFAHDSLSEKINHSYLFSWNQKRIPGSTPHPPGICGWTLNIAKLLEAVKVLLSSWRQETIPEFTMLLLLHWDRQAAARQSAPDWLPKEPTLFSKGAGALAQ